MVHQRKRHLLQGLGDRLPECESGPAWQRGGFRKPSGDDDRFDPSLWQGAAQIEPITLRQFPLRFGDVRTPGHRNLDASVSKNFSVTEKVRAQFRFEMINATNTPWFSRVQSLDVQNPPLGRLNPTQRNLPRWLKPGLVLNW